MKNHQTIVVLENVLANSYALLIKTQNYHWNVAGENFKSLHELFEVQYNDLFESVDLIAERLRALGHKVDASFDAFAKLSAGKKANKNAASAEMIKDLINDNEALVKVLKAGIKTAQDENDEGTADIFITRIKALEKAVWMLEASQ